MSFWTKLAGIFHTVEVVGAKAGPIVGAINPAAGAVLGAAVSAIVAVEQLYPPQTGPDKKAAVTAVAQATAAAHGVEIDKAGLSATIDALVKILNSLPQTEVKPAGTN